MMLSGCPAHSDGRKSPSHALRVRCHVRVDTGSLLRDCRATCQGGVGEADKRHHRRNIWINNHLIFPAEPLVKNETGVGPAWLARHTMLPRQIERITSVVAMPTTRLPRRLAAATRRKTPIAAAGVPGAHEIPHRTCHDRPAGGGSTPEDCRGSPPMPPPGRRASTFGSCCGRGRRNQCKGRFFDIRVTK